MKNYFKLLLILLVLPFCVYAEEAFVIKSYDVDMVVNEDNSFDIKETITVLFDAPRHGIYRSIPTKNTVQRANDTVSTNKALVSNIKVNEEFSTSRENGYVKLQIGNENRLVDDEKTYVISYHYFIGNDPLKDIDEFYFNVIGTEWDTTIEKSTFKITMPKEFDASKLGISTGSFGKVGTEHITYGVDKNVITGEYNLTLEPNEGITVRLELPEGYFISSNKLEIGDLIFLGISLLSFVICIVIWKLYGDDDEVIATVEFYPPEDMNSLEVAFAYNGSTNELDVTSLIVYLASKGYLKITEDDSKKKKKDFKLIKVKEYDGNDEIEKEFFEDLFKNREEVTSKDLKNKFYQTTTSINKKMNSKENKYKYFEKSASSKTWIYFIMIIISILATVIIPLGRFSYLDMIVPILVGMFAGCLIAGAAFGPDSGSLVYVNGKPKRMKKTGRIILFSVIGLIILGLCYLGMYSVLRFNILTNLIFIFSTLSIIGMFVCLTYLPKRTPYGLEMLGKVEGFKGFLETAEKDKLEALVEDNPSYFYDILPYAYVLGVSDKWIKKFEDINIMPPEWYDSSDEFSYTRFMVFMDNTISSASAAMSNIDSSSGGGGGFSGGGSGGGGGGSW